VRKRRGKSGEEAQRRERSVRWWTARSRQPAAGSARGSEGVAIRSRSRERMAGVRQNSGRSERLKRLKRLPAFRPPERDGNCGRAEARAQAQGKPGLEP
jgi:hypothetical protein